MPDVYFGMRDPLGTYVHMPSAYPPCPQHLQCPQLLSANIVTKYICSRLRFGIYGRLQSTVLGITSSEVWHHCQSDLAKGDCRQGTITKPGLGSVAMRFGSSFAAYLRLVRAFNVGIDSLPYALDRDTNKSARSHKL